LIEIAGQSQRVVSGMRPTGKLHLGHYHGVLKNWVQLQHEYDCFFFIADWHALTTHYADPKDMEKHVWDMVVDWLAAGVDPGAANLFIQSRVPQHAELHLLLSMFTPLGWLERVPSFKDQQEKLKDRDLNTYGFFGYPLLQSADILLYRAGQVPVGEDQVPHVELTREVARRFNFLYGRGEGFEEQAESAIRMMGKKAGKMYRNLRKAYQEQGDAEALEKAQALLRDQQNLTVGDKERLLGYLEGGGRVILQEPEPLLTQTPKFPGLDGQKMSKSYGNTIALRDEPARVEKALRSMPTDPARQRRTDPGNPEKCPVWQLHQVYTDASVHEWVKEGCATAGIGCVDCKQPVIDAILREQTEIAERAKQYEEDPATLRNVIEEGNERARDMAEKTMQEVRRCMGVDYTRLV